MIRASLENPAYGCIVAYSRVQSRLVLDGGPIESEAERLDDEPIYAQHKHKCRYLKSEARHDRVTERPLLPCSQGPSKEAIAKRTLFCSAWSLHCSHRDDLASGLGACK